MITWMVSALIASAFLAGAGFALEQTADLLRRPRRWGWLAVMLVAVGLPVVFRFLPAEVSQASSAPPMDPALLAELLALAPTAQAEAGLLDRVLHAPAADPILLTLWVAVTLVLGLTLWTAYRRLRHVRAAGVRVQVAGYPAVVTEATGPVVIGVSRPEIVLPRWIDLLTEEERRLVVRHEWEHVRAGDPRLLMLAALLVAAMPWNLPLWWMRARLRQALELDCDARVLASGADRRTYGTILIQTASRPGPAPLLAPALVELPTLLERRIVAMTGRIPAHRRMRIALATALGALLFVVACEMTPRGSSPSPTEPELADVLEPEAPGVSERVVIQISPEDSIAGRAVRGMIVPDGAVTVIRVGPDGDSTEIRDLRIRVSPLDELSRDGAQPLYIVDGERVESIAQLDPSRIATIEVLKGPMALEQFGAGAENGVVQIRTGEPGEAVRLPLRESSASVQRERSTEIVRDGVGVRLDNREPGESRIQFFNMENPAARPLIIVDGERGVSIEELDPGRIERIEVIKGADATARYGAEGKDGVILVTTRAAARERASAPPPVKAPARVESAATIVAAEAPRVAASSRAVQEVAREIEAAVAAASEASHSRAAEVAPVRAEAAPVAARSRALQEVAHEIEAAASEASQSRTADVARISAEAARVTEGAPRVLHLEGTVSAAAPVRVDAVNAEPLILVEGEAISSLSELNERFPSETIESITVLKDRSATDVYGERGRNGVIIVELKD